MIKKIQDIFYYYYIKLKNAMFRNLKLIGSILFVFGLLISVMKNISTISIAILLCGLISISYNMYIKSLFEKNYTVLRIMKGNNENEKIICSMIYTNHDLGIKNNFPQQKKNSIIKEQYMKDLQKIKNDYMEKGYILVLHTHPAIAAIVIQTLTGKITEKSDFNHTTKITTITYDNYCIKIEPTKSQNNEVLINTGPKFTNYHIIQRYLKKYQFFKITLHIDKNTLKTYNTNM